MSRIAWFCIPAWGHTNPTVEVVRALTARGHQVRYYTFAPFREKLEAAVAGIPVQEATLREWNAALAYLYDAPVEMTAERAKARLLRLLQKRE